MFSMLAKSAGDPNRISPRFKFETRFRLRLQRKGEDLTVGGWARDISESGIGAFVAEELTPKFKLLHLVVSVQDLCEETF